MAAFASLLGLAACATEPPPPLDPALQKQLDLMMTVDRCKGFDLPEEKRGPACLVAADALIAVDNSKAALDALERGCTYKFAPACQRAADAYDKGVGVAANAKSAASYYREACDAGAAEACSRAAPGPSPEDKTADLFNKQFTELRGTDARTLKGVLRETTAKGEKYYDCRKPVDGFTTLVIKNGDKKGRHWYQLRRKPGAPSFERVLATNQTTLAIFHYNSTDSATDAELKARLAQLRTEPGPSANMNRIVAFTKDEEDAIVFFGGSDGYYEISIINPQSR